MSVSLAAVLPFPIEFALFAAVLVAIALFHTHTFRVSMVGLAAIVTWKLAVTGFAGGPGLRGLALHLGHEWVTLANLFLLLIGFEMLARQFDLSRVPEAVPRFLPAGAAGAVALLVLVFVLSSFLDNIAAALIGGTVARRVFDHKVRVGYVAAIVAASNAGGSGSVVGDTTTTMMWIAGVSPLSVLEAYVGAAVALALFSVPIARAQVRHAPMRRSPAGTTIAIDWPRAGVVLGVLAFAIVANVWVNLRYKSALDNWPVIGLAVWAALIALAPVRAPDWRVLRGNLKGTLFLLALVLSASLMPVERLPAASWQTAFGLGIVSAVFDNIPLTALALKQGGYDWGFLAYAVGFGGSMLWFGSSAGVAIVSQFPDARSVTAWLREGWPIAVAYGVGFFVMLALIGWHPDAVR